MSDAKGGWDVITSANGQEDGGVRRIALVFTVLIAVYLAAGAEAVASDCERCDEARSLWEANKCDQALPILKKVTKNNRGSVEALGLQVACYTKVSKRKSAAKALALFLRLDPPLDDILWLRSAIESYASPTPKVEGRFDLPEGVTAPVPLLSSRPIPSAQAQEFKAAGDVVVEGVLRVDGTLGELEEERSGDWSRQMAFSFGESAIACLNGWRYFPALKDGKPVPVRFKAIVRFRP